MKTVQGIQEISWQSVLTNKWKWRADSPETWCIRRCFQ